MVGMWVASYRIEIVVQDWVAASIRIMPHSEIYDRLCRRDTSKTTRE